MFAPANVAVRKSERSSIGSRWRSSSRTNATSATAAIANATRIRVERPAVVVRLDQRVAEREQPERRGDEARDVRPLLARGVARLVDERERGRDRRSAPIGTLMKKIQFQLTCSVIRPPTSGPIASASAETPAQMPIAVPRWRGGKVTVMIESVAGFISAAPRPWTTRARDQHRRRCRRARRRARRR